MTRKTNPRRRPATMADVERAKQEAQAEAISYAMRRYCTSPDCPYHGECNKSLTRLRGQQGWVYEQIGEMDENSKY